MNKTTAWLKTIKVALIVSVAFSGLSLLMEYLYVDNMITTGVDPLGDESQWSLELIMTYIGLSFVTVLATIFLLVATIGFMFRASQWTKEIEPTSLKGKPGIIIAAYFVPVASIVIPFMYMTSMNTVGGGSDSEKATTKKLLILQTVLAAGSYVVGGNSLVDALFGPETQTIQELIDASWRVFASGALDVASMVVLYFLVIRLFNGLSKRAH
ncbi:MAG: DUF4328 domain-containing protein [Micrococcales bacterium]